MFEFAETTKLKVADTKSPLTPKRASLTRAPLRNLMFASFLLLKLNHCQTASPVFDKVFSQIIPIIIIWNNYMFILEE